MDPLAILFAEIGAVLGFIGLGLSVGFAIYFHRTGDRKRLLLVLPGGVIGFIAFVRSITFLATYL